MSSVKKLTIKRGLRSPFSRKSTKKDRDEKEKEYDDDVATTDSKKGGVGGVANGQNLPVEIRESSGRSRKWPFKGKSIKQRAINNGKTEQKESCEAVLSDTTNNTHTHDKPGSTEEKYHKQGSAIEEKCDREAGYATADQNGYPAKWDHEQYVTPVRSVRNHEGNDGDDPSLTCGNGITCNSPDDGSVDVSWTCSSENNGSGMSCQSVKPKDSSQDVEHDTSPDAPGMPGFGEEIGAPRLPPKPPSLRGRRISQISDESKTQDMEPPPRPPARQRNRTMGRDPNPPHLRGIAVPETAGQYETVTLDFPNRVGGSGGGLAAELAKLPRQPWYWGPLTQEEAELKLKNRPDGSFLVRDSSDERYLLSLSFNSHGRSLHTRIEYRGGLFSLNDSEGHASIVELIELAVKESRDGVYGYMRDSLGLQSYPAQLKNWVSRFSEVRPLQHLCRFVIREVYPRHHIQRLPLPKKIKDYILENQY